MVTNICIPGGMGPCIWKRMEIALVPGTRALNASVLQGSGRKSAAAVAAAAAAAIRYAISPYFAYGRSYMKALAWTAKAVKFADCGEGSGATSKRSAGTRQTNQMSKKMEIESSRRE